MNYYDSTQHEKNIDLNKPYSINISHFDDSTNFFAQVNEYFYDFDTIYDEFQGYCDTAKRVDYEQLKSEKNLEKLAIAAKFDDDNVWYRAKVSMQSSVNADFLQFKSGQNGESIKILIEFIDYGNTQLTPVENCVYLNETLSKYKPCAFKCNGIPYLKSLVTSKNSKLDDKLIENLLFYGREIATDEVIQKYDWTSAYFSKYNEAIFLEIDELYRLIYKLNLVEDDFYLNPKEYSENLLKNANQAEIDKLVSAAMTDPLQKVGIDAVVSNLDGGLKYMYFNLSGSINELKALENELELERPESLNRLKLECLVSNRFYLASYKKVFYRVLLLTQNSSTKTVKCQLIDSGKKLKLDANLTKDEELTFFTLTPKYFKYKTFALHCRLALGHNIENVWTYEEKTKFYKEIQAQKTVKIRLVNNCEPYIIEFLEGQNIDFGFGSIISRIAGSINLEPRTLLNGNSATILSEEFLLGGELLKGIFYLIKE